MRINALRLSSRAMFRLRVDVDHLILLAQDCLFKKSQLRRITFNQLFET